MRLRIFVVFALCFGMATLSASVWAKDDANVAKKLVGKVSGKHNHPDYYTTKHGFMNDADLPSMKKGAYIMSWLVLDPPIVLAGGGGAASIGKDFYADYVGVGEEKLTIKNSRNWPIAGQKAKKASEGIGKDGMWWIPINFQDMVDAGQGALFASGNEFDWLEWGGQGLNQFHEYLFCLALWNKGGKVTFLAGSDDPEQTWVDGVKTCEGLGDRNWAADTDKGEAIVPAGAWVPILAEVGENGGEAAYTLNVEPPPDDLTLDVETILAVQPGGKAPVTWGYLKSQR